MSLVRSRRLANGCWCILSHQGSSLLPPRRHIPSHRMLPADLGMPFAISCAMTQCRMVRTHWRVHQSLPAALLHRCAGEAPCIATYWVTRYWQLLLLRLMTGLSLGGILPLVLSLLGDLFSVRCVRSAEIHAVPASQARTTAVACQSLCDGVSRARFVAVLQSFKRSGASTEHGRGHAPCDDSTNGCPDTGHDCKVSIGTELHLRWLPAFRVGGTPKRGRRLHPGSCWCRRRPRAVYRRLCRCAPSLLPVFTACAASAQGGPASETPALHVLVCFNLNCGLVGPVVKYYQTPQALLRIAYPTLDVPHVKPCGAAAKPAYNTNHGDTD